ncbi:unnamed protein product [Penicillium roqueforti FM164]|uniref:Genomic scaffold, ProqFM164S04 n=1 Tax=Penicillium roqueforti (strain FM164) TaxID=1365484 RepID=W6QP96_PENRF|nr:unnamed protein product [Penicillium roqueforti FM164]
MVYNIGHGQGFKGIVFYLSNQSRNAMRMSMYCTYGLWWRCRLPRTWWMAGVKVDLGDPQFWMANLLIGAGVVARCHTMIYA